MKYPLPAIRRTAVLLLLLSVGTDASAQLVRWDTLSKPYGGPVEDLVASKDGYAYALADQIYRSTDGGRTWEKTAYLPRYGAYNRHPISVTDNGVLFAEPAYAVPTKGGAGPGSFWSAVRSEDRGESWTPVVIGDPQNYIRRFAVGAENRVFAVADAGLYKSDDDGDTWQAVQVNPETDTTDVAWLVANYTGDLAVFDFESQKIRVSTDNGATWSAYWKSPEFSIPEAAGILEDGTVYGREEEGVFLVTPDGWTEASYPAGTEWAYPEPTRHGRYILLATSDGAYRSFDRGESWQPFGPAEAISVAPAETAEGEILIGTGWGVYRQLASGDWQFSSTGMSAAFMSDVAIDAENRIYAATGARALFVSSDGARTWEVIHFPHPVHAVAVGPDQDVYAAMDGPPGLQRSSDGGRTWSGLGLRQARTIEVASDGTLYAWGSVGGSESELLRSDDQGASWSSTGFGHRRPTQLRIAPDGDVFAIAADTLYRSADRGASWTEIERSRFYPDPYFIRLHELEVGQADELYLTLHFGRAYRSADDGQSWQEVVVGARLTDLLVSNGFLFASTGLQVFRSSDQAQSWQPVTEPIPPFANYLDGWLSLLAVDPAGRLYAMGPGVYEGERGAFLRTARPVATGAEQEEATASTARLLPPSPSPFRHETTIAFELTRPAHARLAVYDLIGRQVALLADALLTPGRHEVRWTPENLPAGTYFARLEADGRQATQAVLLVR